MWEPWQLLSIHRFCSAPLPSRADLWSEWAGVLWRIKSYPLLVYGPFSTSILRKSSWKPRTMLHWGSCSNSWHWAGLCSLHLWLKLSCYSSHVLWDVVRGRIPFLRVIYHTPPKAMWFTCFDTLSHCILIVPDEVLHTSKMQLGEGGLPARADTALLRWSLEYKPRSVWS